MASRTKLLTDLTVADLWKEVKDPATLWGDQMPEAQRTLKLLLQNRLHEELTHYLHAPRYARVPGRRGVRNGCYVRALTTTWGTIPDLEIPRARDRGFVSSVLPRYQRRMQDVDRLIRAVFLAGISTRRVGRSRRYSATPSAPRPSPASPRRWTTRSPPGIGGRSPISTATCFSMRSPCASKRLMGPGVASFWSPTGSRPPAAAS